MVNPSTATRLRLLCGFLQCNDTTAFAVENHSRTCSQGSRSGNPGLEDIAPLGQSGQLIQLSQSNPTTAAATVAFRPFDP